MGGHPKADEVYSVLVNLYGVRYSNTSLLVCYILILTTIVLNTSLTA